MTNLVTEDEFDELRVRVIRATDKLRGRISPETVKILLRNQDYVDNVLEGLLIGRDHHFDRSVDEVDLSVRACNTLKNIGIGDVRGLVTADVDFLRSRLTHKVSLEVADFLEKEGLCVGMHYAGGKVLSGGQSPLDIVVPNLEDD